MVVFLILPASPRRPLAQYGGTTLFRSQRIGAGSRLTSDWVDISRHEVKSFGARGNVRGSWRIQVSFGGTQEPFTLADGTFPAGPGPGTIKTISFTEAFKRARLELGLSAVGSVSGYYGGLAAAGR